MGLLLAVLMSASPVFAAPAEHGAAGAADERAMLFAEMADGDLPCVDRREVGLCLTEDWRADPFAGAWLVKVVPAGPPSRLILFTRLAGMFMGRVDAASVGSYRLRFKLTLR